jgi:hypothetical protein
MTLVADQVGRAIQLEKGWRVQVPACATSWCGSRLHSCPARRRRLRPLIACANVAAAVDAERRPTQRAALRDRRREPPRSPRADRREPRPRGHGGARDSSGRLRAAVSSSQEGREFTDRDVSLASVLAFTVALCAHAPACSCGLAGLALRPAGALAERGVSERQPRPASGEPPATGEIALAVVLAGRASSGRSRTSSR